MENKKIKIAAVVVTYNRLELLKECVASLRNQTRKLDEIIIVNNDSTDGTKKWLDEQKDLTVIHQANLGGAGGFHTGIKTAYEKGYDWIWVMDDDGYPKYNCLKNLEVKINDKTEVIGAFVIDKNDNKSLAFPCPNINNSIENRAYNREYIENLYPEIIADWVVLFNGVLLPLNLIKEIGYPMKELFIWGDEFEYLRRIKRKKIRYYTVSNAIFYHPKLKLKTDIYWFAKEVIADFKKEIKYFYFFRNLGYLSKEDYRFYNIKYVIAQFVYYLRPKKFNPCLAYFFLSSYIKGIFSNYSK